MWKTFVYVGGPSKNNANEDIIITQDFQKEGLKNEQPRVIKFGYPIMPTRKEKYQSQHVPLH
jgi:hypothetical protein